MKVTAHTLCWNNVDPRILNSHAQVMEKFDLSVNYTKANIPHGTWMNAVCRDLDSDVFVFFDADCVPLDRAIVDETIKYAIANDTFMGIAQASNHIPPYNHIFAAPAFFVITKSCYRSLGNPSFSENSRSDVAEEVSHVAEISRKRYRCLYPTRFDGVPVEGVWRLSNYGYFGIGTLFADRIYHLYQGRFNKNVELFVRRCDQIVRGEFDMTGMHDSLKEFDGRVVA
jgi:hypothetical protein